MTVPRRAAVQCRSRAAAPATRTTTAVRAPAPRRLPRRALAAASGRDRATGMVAGPLTALGPLGGAAGLAGRQVRLLYARGGTGGLNTSRTWSNMSDISKLRMNDKHIMR